MSIKGFKNSYGKNGNGSSIELKWNPNLQNKLERIAEQKAQEANAQPLVFPAEFLYKPDLVGGDDDGQESPENQLQED